jgi:hypothetical protein
MGVEALDVLADRGYFKGEEVLACEPLGVTPYVPKPLTSGSKAAGRFSKAMPAVVRGENPAGCRADCRPPRVRACVPITGQRIRISLFDGVSAKWGASNHPSQLSALLRSTPPSTTLQCSPT